MAEKKEKQFVSDNAQLMAEWDWEKNNELGFDPKKLTCGNGKKVWWKCPKGHEWQAVIRNRNNGYGCPYCSGNKVLKGYNDLQTVNPTLAKEWNYNKNGILKPDNFTANSGKKVWWNCSLGHEWQATIDSRNERNGCPYCSGKKVLKGYNDLQTVNPTLAQEWNYNKNGILKPDSFTANSGKKVWWKCQKGHEWQSIIANRNKGIGCPICASEQNTSFPEYAILFYLQKYCSDVVHSHKKNGYELDIYIPSKKIAIEYDGYYWHRNKINKDLDKNRKCEIDGIRLYRIREELAPLNDSSIDYIVRKDQKDLSIILEKILFEIIGTSIDIDINRDAVAIENLREYTQKSNSLLFLKPEIAKEWNYDKNGILKPDNFTANSGKKVWWNCSQGHEWQDTIVHRNNGRGCPYCSNHKLLKGYNDLQTINPILTKEWDYSKNNRLTPEDVMPNSSKKVWWKCQKGHEWQAKIANRNKGHGCPYCAGQKVLKGYTDLHTLNSILAKEWDYAKNNGLTPEDVMPNSSQKVWWKCQKGHEWQATIANRNKDHGCPYCAGKRVLIGYNDLQTVNPMLANEWHFDKNYLMPTDVSPNSEKKVWWKCSLEHEWEATVVNRNKGSGCPYCSSRKVLIGFNDLQTNNPKLSEQWDYNKNEGLTPKEVTPNSNKKVWWVCDEGHEWQATIASRNKGCGCPICYQNKRKSK